MSDRRQSQRSQPISTNTGGSRDDLRDPPPPYPGTGLLCYYGNDSPPSYESVCGSKQNTTVLKNCHRFNGRPRSTHSEHDVGDIELQPLTSSSSNAVCSAEHSSTGDTEITSRCTCLASALRHSGTSASPRLSSSSQDSRTHSRHGSRSGVSDPRRTRRRRTSGRPQEPKPRSFMLVSVLTCLCFNPVIGLIAIILSATSDTLANLGETNEARQYGFMALGVAVGGTITTILVLVTLWYTGALSKMPSFYYEQ